VDQQDIPFNSASTMNIWKAFAKFGFFKHQNDRFTKGPKDLFSFRTNLARSSAITLPSLKESFRKFCTSLEEGRLFFTKNDEFLKVENQNNEMATLTIGVTNDGLERIGEVQSIIHADKKFAVHNESICGLVWTGYKMTGTSDLYVPQYHGIRGIRWLPCPFPTATIIQYNEKALKKPHELRGAPLEDGWLARIQVDKAALPEVTKNMMNLRDYVRRVDDEEEEYGFRPAWATNMQVETEIET